jgi:hypothetical protein
MLELGGMWKMSERARQALVSAGEISSPGDEWPEEPDEFNGLRFGMSEGAAARVVELGECIQKIGPMLAVKARLKLGHLDVAGRLDFHADRLVHISGEFDIACWEFVKSEFVLRYGAPHHLSSKISPQWGLFEELSWSGGRIAIGLSGFPSGARAGCFYLDASCDVYTQYLKTESSGSREL